MFFPSRRPGVLPGPAVLPAVPAAVPRSRRSRRSRASRPWPCVALALARAELLVDADRVGVEMVRNAIRRLKEDFRRVRATLFTAPHEFNKWQQLLSEGVRFYPVATGSEATDKAIQQQIARTKKDSPIALLTHDTDFIRSLVEFQAAGGQVMVMVPEYKHVVVRKYQSQGLKVLKMTDVSSKPRGSKVRAVLCKGQGWVQLVPERYQAVNNEDGAQEVRHFLETLGYCKGKAYLAPACAKFWVTNEIAKPLTVFPTQLSTLAVHELTGLTGSWKKSAGDLAFLLPLKVGGWDRTLEEVYGNSWAYSVFEGKGPLVLKDSPQLAAQVLRKLGYLENQDLLEAMFCFINSVDMGALRKAQLLPKHGDNVQVVKDQLRRAFVSNATPGHWHRSVPCLYPMLERILRQEQLLSPTSSRPELLKAMKRYVKTYNLPMMHTFKGLQLRILHHNNQRSESTSMQLIEIDQ